MNIKVPSRYVGKRKGRPPTYPWEQWMKEGKLRFRKGIHFFGMSHSFIQTVRQHANHRGFSCSVKELTPGMVYDVTLTKMDKGEGRDAT